MRTLGGFGRLAAAAVLSCAVIVPALAKGPPKPLSDWPCQTPLAGPLEPEMLWPGVGPALPPEGAWADDPLAHRLVNFLTAGENSPAMGQREIEAVAREHGPFEQGTSLLVVSGMVERGNKLRVILLEGIKTQIIKSHVLAAAIDENGAKIAALQKPDSGEAKKELDGLRQARRQNLNMLDDADDTAEELCHRLAYDEAKLKTLAATLKAHTQ